MFFSGCKRKSKLGPIEETKKYLKEIILMTPDPISFDYLSRLFSSVLYETELWSMMHVNLNPVLYGNQSRCYRRRVSSSANPKVPGSIPGRSHTGFVDYDEACFMHLTPGVVHNFTKAVGV